MGERWEGCGRRTQSPISHCVHLKAFKVISSPPWMWVLIVVPVTYELGSSDIEATPGLSTQDTPTAPGQEDNQRRQILKSRK